MPIITIQTSLTIRLHMQRAQCFIEQLGYIVGAQVRDKILLEYYRLWRFKHPNAQDFISVAEKVSKMKLDWYKEYWINSTKTIDYGIDSLVGGRRKNKNQDTRPWKNSHADRSAIDF